jgi:hypothetical protein
LSARTPDVLAREVGRTGLQVRSYLRATYPDAAPGRGGRWWLTPTQVQAVLDHFGHGPATGRKPRREPGPAARAAINAVRTNVVMASLIGPGQAIDTAVVPAKPGLYAIYAAGETWQQLGLGTPPDGRPLYVGKAEDSLVARDLRQHFTDGRTGSSTLRRSFAALLHDSKVLRGIPRNPRKPGYFSNYGLSAKDDEMLSKWMSAHLAISTWAPESAVTLADVEMEIVKAWLPPLNLAGVRTAWSDYVSSKRRVMAQEARAWRPRD